MLKPSAAAVDELYRLIAPAASSPVPVARSLLEPALEALVRIGDWRALPYLGWLLTGEETRGPAANAVRALMPEDCEALRRLEEGTRGFIRGGWWPSNDKPFPWTPRWKEREARAIMGGAMGDAILAGFLSFAPGGHAREAAVRALADCRGGRELPFLLLRINDWVEPVAERALRACSERLVEGYERHFASSLTLVTRLREVRRRDHAGFVDRVEQVPGLK